MSGLRNRVVKVIVAVLMCTVVREFRGFEDRYRPRFGNMPVV